jgi:hypothetical protein
MTTNLEMPKTETPREVYTYLIGLVVILGFFLVWLLGLFWGVAILLVILAAMTGYYTEEVQGYNARILLDSFTGQQRTLFQGLNFKLPWEHLTRMIDLQVNLTEVLMETYASQDALMETKYTYTLRPDFSGNNAGDNIILYASYQGDAIETEARSLLSMLLSDYYGGHAGSELLDKQRIYREVFEGEPGKSLIADFEENHGVKITMRIKDSDFDAETQSARNTISRAKSFSDAVQKLIDGGMVRPDAEKVAKMMNLPGVREYIISLKAEGLENLRDINLGHGLGGTK